jgi:DNA-binding response OmpR family regulator
LEGDDQGEAFSDISEGLPVFTPTGDGNSYPVGQSATNRSTILLVEDYKDMLDYLLRTLQPDYRVLTAANGRQGLQLLQQSEVTLIIADLMMPEMDGFELLRRVREAGIWVPFILLTARSEAEDRIKALELGVDLFMTKPLVVEELFAGIDNLLRRSRERNVPGTAVSITANEAKVPEQEQVAQLWLAELEVFLEKELGNPELRIGDLANYLGISERTLRNRIKEYVNMSPKQYVQHKRLEHAWVLLRNRQYATVNELSFACGFRSATHFSKLFKAHFGYSPSSYL